MLSVTIVNLILCVVILILGIWGYSAKKNAIPLFIGIAFGLFGLTHLLALLGLEAGLSVFFIVVRLVAYLLVIIALFKLIVGK